MFRKKVKEDPTELQLLKIRVRNLEKEIAERSKKMDINTYNKEAGQEAAAPGKWKTTKHGIALGSVSDLDHWSDTKTHNSPEQILTDALAKELQTPGDDIRTYLIDSLVDNLCKIQAGSVKAPHGLDDMEVGPTLLSLANKGYSPEMKQMLTEWSSAALSIAKKREAPQVQTEELESIVKLKLNGENFT